MPHSSSSFSEMLAIALAIKEQGKYVPLFLIHWKDNHNAVKLCLDHDIGYFLHNVKEQKGAKKGSKNKIIPKAPNHQIKSQLAGKGTIKKLQRTFLIQLLYYLMVFAREKFAAKRLLAKYNPICILTVGDRHVGIETALVTQANTFGIPSIILPFALSDRPSSAAYRLAQKDWETTFGMSSRINRWLAKIKPKWVYETEQYRLLWNSSAWMIAAHVICILPVDPWNLGGGRAWKMALESDQARDILVSEGLHPQKIEVVGKPRYDNSANIKTDRAKWRETICRDFELDPDKPILLCSVPQLAEHELLSWDEHWEDIEFLFQGLAKAHDELNVILSLHPKSDLNHYLPRAETYGHIIASTYSYDQLIPICDAFVATFSSTLTLAIVSQTPSVVIDFDWFGYDTFDDVSGIVVVRDRAQFVPTLQRLFSDRAYYDRLVEGLRESAPYWGRFDGNATERVLNLMDKYIQRGNEIRKLPKHERRRALPPWSR